MLTSYKPNYPRLNLPLRNTETVVPITDIKTFICSDTLVTLRPFLPLCHDFASVCRSFWNQDSSLCATHLGLFASNKNTSSHHHNLQKSGKIQNTKHLTTYNHMLCKNANLFHHLLNSFVASSFMLVIWRGKLENRQ